jgi:hypothetical protein
VSTSRFDGVVKSVRRRGVRLANDLLVVGNSKALDDVEIVLGLP